MVQPGLASWHTLTNSAKVKAGGEVRDFRVSRMETLSRQVRCLATFLLAASAWCAGQTLKSRPPVAPTPSSTPDSATPALTVAMTVPTGTPIKVALDSEVRIREVGQAIHGKTTEPVYAFDKLLIPVGTPVNGKVSAIDAVSKKTRTLEAMDGNFSPVRSVHVQFDELVMADGRIVPMHTVASPAAGGILQFVPASEKARQKNKVQDAAEKKVSATRQQIRQQWANLQKQIHEPGKTHKLKRIALAQLPVHPQYIEAGTSFNADLQQPLDFGTESLKPEQLASIGAPPPMGSAVHARLVTPLSSATSKKGDTVEALITQPLVVSDHLILPEGSKIRGSVIQAQPARRLARNGQLRILFHDVAPPDGVAQRVQTSLEGVAVAKGEHLKLDAEGGAQATSPRTRYFTTGLQLAVAAVSDDDFGPSAASGASGFRFVGVVVGVVARSRIVSRGFGAYGAATSIYSHFLARGRDVVYPQDMAMVIGLGTRESKPAATPPATGANQTDAAASPTGQRGGANPNSTSP